MLQFLFKKHSVFLVLKILLVLGMLIILLAAALVVYPGVRDINQANTEIANLSLIKANVNKMHASQEGDYSGLSRATANQAHVFPEKMNKGDFTAAGDIRSSWGGTVDVGMATGTRPSFYTIKYTAVPAGVCLMLASGSAPYFEQVTINGTALMTDESHIRLDAHEGGKFNPGQAATACSAGFTSTIEFTAR